MLRSDYVLLAYIFFLVPLMLVGFGFARRRLFVPHHKAVMTLVMIINWILILAIMIPTYVEVVPSGVRTGTYTPSVVVPILHGLIGGVAQVIATYLVIRMWFENQLPDWFKVKNIKRLMRFTLAMWLLTALFGLGVWATFFQERVKAAGATPAGTPAATEDATRSAIGTPAATVAATDDATPAGTPAATPAATEDATPAASPAATEATIPITVASAVPPATKTIATPAATKAIATPAATPAATP